MKHRKNLSVNIYSNENYATDSAGGVVTWEAFGRVWVICVFRVPVPCKIWDHVKLCVVLELEWWSEAERGREGEKEREREIDWKTLYKYIADKLDKVW